MVNHHIENIGSGEGRVHEQASDSTLLYGQDTKISSNKSLEDPLSMHVFRTGCPLTKEELLLYSIVKISFPENGFNFKAKTTEKYEPIILAVDRVYNSHFKNYNFRNYFHRSSHNLMKNLGKVKGVLSWVYYKDNVIEVLERFTHLLKGLLTDSNVVLGNDIEELKSFIQMQCKNATAESDKASTSSEKFERTDSFIIEQIPELHIFDF